MVLLTFLRWLRANSDYQFGVLLGRGGALEPDSRQSLPLPPPLLRWVDICIGCLEGFRPSCWK